ncbi:unnamed protein product [Meloidogyne enterolobii]|uniref:Uncharacterized protein n=1 Tax=Meloidogyne enterolobii TaxID=390850 RepID=A0ACB0YUE2_MELEN
MKYTQFFVQAFAFLALTKICYSAEVSRPEYLSIEGFQNCTGSKTIGTYQIYCLPEIQNGSCANSSWEALHKLNSNDSLQPCEDNGTTISYDDTTTIDANTDNGNEDKDCNNEDDNKKEKNGVKEFKKLLKKLGGLLSKLGHLLGVSSKDNVGEDS